MPLDADVGSVLGIRDAARCRTVRSEGFGFSLQVANDVHPV
jgi:hypothetical protein